ncbi:unnamed protein product [Phytomonas sp. EM1]|nr:unnamed protein product [Phytomonas sp. EM1]|eukprot:CCW63976.1 unnamed protein product [Phytomonas sp. isolate EM1]
MAEKILNNILDAVGNTPCIRLNRIPQKYGLRCEVVAKCEFLNPGGSVKDRVGKNMVLTAEAEGRLKPGAVLVEPTSGNTGVALSMAAAVRGYEMVITMSSKMSHEKEVTMNALGAKVIRTPASLLSEHPDSLFGVANRLVEEKGCIMLDQYNNPANPKAHELTAMEIYNQCDGKIDMVVCSTGTGGTMTGIATRLKELLPNVIIVGADPVGSILADPEHDEVSPYMVEGVGYDFIPKVCERDRVDRWVKTVDKESFELALELNRLEGLMVGGSSGAALSGALQAAKDLREDQRCVVILPDTLRNYLGKFADNNWMIERGLAKGEVIRPTYEALAKEVKELKERLAKYESPSQ